MGGPERRRTAGSRILVSVTVQRCVNPTFKIVVRGLIFSARMIAFGAADPDHAPTGPWRG
jgi:hypothetical protein